MTHSTFDPRFSPLLPQEVAKILCDAGLSQVAEFPRKAPKKSIEDEVRDHPELKFSNGFDVLEHLLASTLAKAGFCSICAAAHAELAVDTAAWVWTWCNNGAIDAGAFVSTFCAEFTKELAETCPGCCSVDSKYLRPVRLIWQIDSFLSLIKGNVSTSDYGHNAKHTPAIEKSLIE